VFFTITQRPNSFISSVASGIIRSMKDCLEGELLEKLKRCPLFLESFGPSLRERINTPHWFENRFIQAILRDTGWMEEHEGILEEADIEGVNNSQAIFSDLHGGAPDYDLKVFDVLAEVRLIRWASENGYTDIEKLIPSGSSIPDFLMKKGGEVAIAEAKHFRARDFLPDSVGDRLKGLVLTTGYLTEFGIFGDTTDKYGQIRDFLLGTRKQCEYGYREAIRNELTEEWLKALECSLADDPNRESEIIYGLFVVKRVDIPHEASVGLFGPHKNERDAAELMLEKLCGNLISALKQIKSFIDNNPTEGIPSKALVFLSGTDPWSIEWSDMWDAMCNFDDDAAWRKVEEIHKQAEQLINLPFELVVGKGSPVRYVPFPWTRKR